MARFTLRYVLPLAKLSLLAGLALSGCGGGSDSTTGPTPVTPETETVAAAPVATRPAPAPAPGSTPAPRQFLVTAHIEQNLVSGFGCVVLHAESPARATGCATQVQITGAQGTRGTVTAVPAANYEFAGWARSSSDCPGETTNPCSFAFAANKTMIATFGWNPRS